MQTSYFFNPKIDRQDPRLISIALWSPRGWCGRRYPLAPTRGMLGMDEATYRAEYQKLLDNLDPQKVFEDLGEDAILLCWETPGRFCHRRLVAEWLEKSLGVEILEYVAPEKQAKLFK